MPRAAILLVCVLAAGTGIAQPPFAPPAPRATDKPLPINLASALQLAQARSVDVALAAARVQSAAAALDRANVLWLPNILMGPDYTRHDGRIQDIRGHVINSGKQAFFLGAGPLVNFNVSNAIYAPLAARQVTAARTADVQATTNDVTLAVAEAYFTVQQARGDYVSYERAVRDSEELVRRTDALAPGIAPPLEANRARAELARRRLALNSARERWQVASAELARICRLDPSVLVEPAEPPTLKVTLIDPKFPVDDLIGTALSNRPELASRQAIVQATLALLKQEKIRPLVPSVIFRGNSTGNPGFATGLYGGGINSEMRDFGTRGDVQIQLAWEFQNLGLGNRARVRERQAEQEAAIIDVFRTQDRVAAEVATAYAQLQSARDRITDAETAWKEASETVEKSIEGLSQTRRVGEYVALVIRPQEVVAAIQALAQISADYFAAVQDFNRAEFRLYRAMGQPAQALGSMANPDLPPPPAAPSAEKSPEIPKISKP